MRGLSAVRPGRDVQAEHAWPSPRVGRAQALEDLDGRRLAGAVRAEQAEDLAAGDLEVDAVDGDEVAVALGQAADADHRIVGERGHLTCRRGDRLHAARWCQTSAKDAQPATLSGVVEPAGPVDVERDRRSVPRSSSGAGAPRPRYASIAASRPTSRPASSERIHFSSSTSQYAWSGSRLAPIGRAGARRGSARGRRAASARPPPPRSTGRRSYDSSQARYSRRSLSSSRAWPSRATSPVRRSSSRAWNRRLATATRSADRPARRPARLQLDLVDREAEVVQPPDPGPDRVPVVGRELGLEVELLPDARRTVVRTVSAASTASSKASGAALHRAEVGQAERDVLDEDVEVVGALAVGQRRVDLARLGIDEEGLDLVAVAPEQRVRERAVAPEHAGPVEVDEQPRHRVEQPVAVRARARAGSASAGAGTGSSTRGTRSRGWPTSRSGASARPTAVTAGRPSASRWRSTSNSAVGDAERLLLERVGPCRRRRGTGRGGATGRPGSSRNCERRRTTTSAERPLPGQVEQRRRRRRAAGAAGTGAWRRRGRLGQSFLRRYAATVAS